MPYISAKDDRREKLRNGEPALIAGELNYQIFHYVKHSPASETFETSRSIIRGLVEQFLGAKPNYQRFNDMTGALVRCSKEVNRRLGNWLAAKILIEIMESFDNQIDIYEDIKIKENTDVE
jgi:hypothetical protein